MDGISFISPILQMIKWMVTMILEDYIANKGLCCVSNPGYSIYASIDAAILRKYSLLILHALFLS